MFRIGTNRVTCNSNVVTLAIHVILNANYTLALILPKTIGNTIKGPQQIDEVAPSSTTGFLEKTLLNSFNKVSMFGLCIKRLHMFASYRI